MRKLAIFFFFSPFTHSMAQSADTAINSLYFKKDSLLNVYYSFQDSSQVYNGRQFYGYLPSIEGDPFYPLNSMSRGQLLYNGVWYREVGLMYDAYKDELIARHPPPFEVDMILFRERVSEFIVIGKDFVYISKDKNDVLSEGFYQRLANGKAVFLVKRRRELDERIYGNKVESKFIEKDRFYIGKGELYYRVKKGSDLLNLFKDKRDELSSYKKKLKLKFREDPEDFILKITNYYNELQQ